MNTPSPRHARIQVAVTEAVEICGGVEAAGSVTGRGKTTAGNWHTNTHDKLPDVAQGLTLDSVAVAQGREPPITGAMARELGGVFLPLDAADPCEAALPGHVMQLTTELGDLSRRVGEALADGKVCRDDASKIEREINDLIAVAVRARAHVQRLQERG